ncbi:replicative DNA helicase [Schaalia vaccimaxillae]|uniref:replicative DNA helicase n=1 Tax=Schaalia vaccimaxillae TaxID=183916 RepID=UPI0003B5398F|nr:replicative DNA helicase [Schaalia vaccimaxillae]
MAAEDFDRIPPQDIDAEMSVLGSMMLTTDAIDVVLEILRGTDFYMPNHEIIFDAIIDLHGSGIPADAITVAGDLKTKGLLTKIGGAAYLHSLISSVPTAANAGYYAKIVHDAAVMRRLVTAGTRVVQLGYSEAGGEIEEIVDQAQAEVFAVAQGRSGTDYHSMSAMSEEILLQLEDIENNQGKLTGVPTGFTDLDNLTQGLRGGQMIIVAARPAMGKSTLALDICRSASIKHKITSLIFSLEMSHQEITMRMLSAESGVRLSKMQAGKMSDIDWRKVAETTSRIADAPLYVDDSANITISEIRSKCRRLKQQENLGLVVIDYLQLMTTGQQVESRQQEVSAMSRNLKLLAKDLEVPVIAVAQLNRNSESRNDRKPMMSDLRESGSLEQDADIIMLLHRPDYYNKEDRPGEADIIVAKHRNGATDTITALFQGDMARFVNFTGRPEPDGGSAPAE